MEEEQGSGRKEVSDTEVNDCPIEQVRLTVPITDDPTIPALTIRAWVLGMFFALIEASTTGIAVLRQTPVFIPAVIWQLVTLPIGRFLARVTPTTRYKIPGTKFSFTLNPGPFSVKEHALISVMIETGFIAPFLTSFMTLLRVQYELPVNLNMAIMMNTSTQMLGLGVAGVFMKFMVDNPYMWWPTTLLNVVVYRTLHRKEERKKGSVTRMQFFVITGLASFVYGMIPGYLFPAATCISVLCLIWKKSILAQQIGSGTRGFGIGAFSLSWEALNYGSIYPFTMPLFAINNIMFGFLLFAYVMVPLVYYNNIYKAKNFPLSSVNIFDVYGDEYNETRVSKDSDYTFDEEKYKSYSKVYMSAFRGVGMGFTFASLSAGLVHVFIYHGKEMYHSLSQVYGRRVKTDVHGRLMRKYKTVPASWYFVLFSVTLSASLYSCNIGINKHMRLPVEYVLAALLISVSICIPDAILQASTGQGLQTHTLISLIGGYVNRGKNFQNMLLKNLMEEVPAHIVQFCSTLKFGHYMKIPPRDMFISQICTTAVTTFVNMRVAWMVIKSIDHICNKEKLPVGSPWTCPIIKMAGSNAAMWGLVGPQNVFVPYGIYRHLFWGFVIGAALVIIHWMLTKKFPRNKFLASIFIPTILSGADGTPPGGTVNWWFSYVLGVINGWYVFKYHKKWWSRYNYLFGSAISIGTSLVAFFVFLTLQQKGLYGPYWWGLNIGDHCPLASCPLNSSIECKPVLPG